MAEQPKVIGTAHLSDFFRAEVAQARQELGVSMLDVTEYYLVNLLCDYGRRDQVPMPGDEPLALLYKRASEASPAQRIQLLKDLGDLALYVSGFFAESIERSLVDLDYYIAMGGTAYGKVASLVGMQRQGDLFVELYGQLAVRFTEMVDVLHEVAEHAREKNETPTQLLQLYDRWVRTHSERSRRRLLERGLVPHNALPTEYLQ